MQRTKKLFSVLITGALLCAGLYYFLGREAVKSPKLIKPSQLDFSQSNQLQEPAQAKNNTETKAQSADNSSDAESVPATLSEREQQLWAAFEEILLSKNDSDPRVSQLIRLSPDFNKALTDKYASLKMEDRNGRGFIVFLIAKNLQTAADLEFLQQVYRESPCLSLSDCTTIAREDNPHNSGVDQTTMNYPQLVVLYQLDTQLTANPALLNDPSLRAGVLATLKQAEVFPVPMVRERAERLRKKYHL